MHPTRTRYFSLPLVFFVLMLTVMASPARSGCKFPSSRVAVQIAGYGAYVGLLTQVDRKTGKSFKANQGVYARDATDCVLKCEANPHCRAVTSRGSRPRNCLLFVGFDFSFGRPLELRLHKLPNHLAVIVRDRYRGALCKGGSGGGGSSDGSGRDVPVLNSWGKL